MERIPSAALEFSSLDGKQNSILHIGAETNIPFPALRIFVVTRTGSESPKYTFAKDFNLRDAVHVRFSLSDKGKVSLDLGQKTYTADFVPLASAKMIAACSTGDFNFEGLTFTPTSSRD